MFQVFEALAGLNPNKAGGIDDIAPNALALAVLLHHLLLLVLVIAPYVPTECKIHT